MPTQNNNVTLRVPKGSDLTIEELDNNFNELVSLANGPCITGDKGPIGPTGLQGAIYSVDTPINPDPNPTSKTWIVYDPDLNTITEFYEWTNGTWILKSFKFTEADTIYSGAYKMFMLNIDGVNRNFIISYGNFSEFDSETLTITNNIAHGLFGIHSAPIIGNYFGMTNLIALSCGWGQPIQIIDLNSFAIHSSIDIGFEYRGGVIYNNNLWIYNNLNNLIEVRDLDNIANIIQTFSNPGDDCYLTYKNGSIYTINGILRKFDPVSITQTWDSTIDIDNSFEISPVTNQGVARGANQESLIKIDLNTGTIISNISIPHEINWTVTSIVNVVTLESNIEFCYVMVSGGTLGVILRIDLNTMIVNKRYYPTSTNSGYSEEGRLLVTNTDIIYAPNYQDHKLRLIKFKI